MTIIGALIFYIGFFGFFIGIFAFIRGGIDILRIKDKKHALKIIGISVILAIIGSAIIGPEPKQTSEIQKVQIVINKPFISL
jgi:hypothetical protein